jgi:membrane protein YdbS with pleckstrin-like domain
VGAVCGILLFLLLALYAFWIKNAVMGLIMAFLLIVLVERTLHSEYIISDGKLIINNGKLARAKTINIQEIHDCKPMTSVFGLVRYLLLTYGASDRMISVQPQNEAAFITTLQKEMRNSIKNDLQQALQMNTEKEACDAE